MPGVDERAEIWQLQIHPTKTPIASDVDFHRLAKQYVASGGDIKNAVIKAAAAAAAEPGPDISKTITQKHFEAAMEDVIAARSIMQQSVFNDRPATTPIEPIANLQTIETRLRTITLASIGLAAAAFLAALLALVLVALR
jgi:ATP-dependent Zn protease